MWRPCGVFDETYSSDMSIVRTKFHWICLIVSLLFVMIFPLFDNYYLLSLFNKMAIMTIVAMGLQILSGMCGQISFGQAAFMSVGAYTSCILTNIGLSFWIVMPIAGIVSGLIGLLGGTSALRVKGFYLAIATLALHFVIIWLTMHLEITGSTEGLHMDPPTFFGILIDTEPQKFYVIISVLALMTYGARNLVRTRVGRVFVAIRDNDLAAQVMGINLFYYKLLAFFIACFYAGIGGSLWVLWLNLAHPDQFGLMDNVYYLGMIIIGGLGSIPGVFFGVVFIVLLDEILMLVAPPLSTLFPSLGMEVSANLSLSIFGIAIVLFLIYEPRGLYRTWNVIKNSLRVYPFTY
ncbi:MAG: branched-chain amino acid ABC transporter permease [Desulfatiglans sp.]|jgi:branched-chain amino acid transport system permease protein|nr:branched-chain amino acid ABC transporter permease [Thermodesulfobacteriota bacterium]MEE4353671.1 branched-chain amino acid ABC transporter permease [Desulfatiglans sp.]